MTIATPHVHAQRPQKARNPIIWADVPDTAITRVGDTYYMSSTTMHLSPGLPIMKSKDLVNWQIVRYAYDTLGDEDALNLANGKNAYGRGSWASSLRYHNGTFYATTFSSTTGKTYVYSTKNIEKEPWEVHSFHPAFHDHSLFFDDDNKVYMLYGVGNLRLVELTADAFAVKEGGFNDIVVSNASAPAGTNINLQAEGSQLFKHDGKYYLFNITWPRGGMRTVLVHRATKITGPYEGRVALQDKGVAQGSLIDAPNGAWFAYLFRDFGAVGRIPYLVPVAWKDGWPVLGADNKVPDTLNLPASRGLIPGIVASDDFDSDVLTARNTLTQRTFGPECSGETSVDVRGLKNGDFAGLMLLQKKYGFVGVTADNGKNYLVMVNTRSGQTVEVARILLTQTTVFLKAECNFNNRTDSARFFYRLDNKPWVPIGTELKMIYTLDHFMGYRFGLFHYATKTAGGNADFDFFHVSDRITSITGTK